MEKEKGINQLKNVYIFKRLQLIKLASLFSSIEQAKANRF
jgi:hypothetical protein